MRRCRKTSGTKTVTTRIAYLIGTWFGSGYSPVAPGTAGSLVALAIAWLCHVKLGWGALEFAVLAVVVTGPGLWAARRVALSSGEEDPGIVVVDEVAGLWLTLAGMTSEGWPAWVGGFVLFRLFDIWKPPPVRQLERLRGGVGVMADDMMAGVYGALILFAAGRLGWY